MLLVSLVMFLVVMMMMMMMMMFASVPAQIHIALASILVAQTTLATTVTVAHLLVTLRIHSMMMMIAMSPLLLRGLVTQHSDNRFLVRHAAAALLPASLRVGCGDRGRNEAVGSPLRHDHVDLRVRWSDHTETVLGKCVPLEDAVRAAAAVCSRLELGKVVREFESGEALRCVVVIVVLHTAHHMRYAAVYSTWIRSVHVRITSVSATAECSVSFESFIQFPVCQLCWKAVIYRQHRVRKMRPIAVDDPVA